MIFKLYLNYIILLYMKIVLFYPKENKNIEINEENVIDELYNNLAIILENDIKDYVSKLNYKIPLFDYSTKNIYLINKEDTYLKVVHDNFRFPDKKIIDLLKKTINDLNKLKNNNDEWVIKYIKKLNKNLNFLDNFNLSILKETFTEAFLNTNPTSRELTTCIKPSYLPYQNYQSPYYTKSELISMALNLNIIKDKNIKPWSYDDIELKKICLILSQYEISTQLLIYNQLYILYNNAKSYVQFYSLFGSYYFNSYLRNKNSLLDKDLNSHINNMLKIIEKSPPLDSNYETYRFIENDDYLHNLKIGDTFDENSFISTSRNPFYSIKDNVFGFILIKIKLKKNIPGIALLMESYSNYQHEEEVLLPPSTLKLLEINTDFNYYHWNKLAEKKIVKKYVFEYIKPISYDIKYYIKDFIKDNINIPLINFFNVDFSGSTINEKTLNFFVSLTKINLRRIFRSIIGNKEYIINAYFLTQNKVYSKFFFLQRTDELNKTLGDEIYLSIQNPDNGEIELLVEIRNIISVNYYFRYSGVKSKISDEDLIHWLSGLAKSLNIQNIIIHGNYSSYIEIVENILDKSGLNKMNLLEDFKTIQNIDNPDSNILNLYTADINTYCIDMIDYLYNNKKRFYNMSYIERKVPIHAIDKLKKLKFKNLYKTNNVDYETLNRLYNKLGDINLSDFYKIIHESYPYLIQKLEKLIILTYPKNIIIPWHFYYVLKPFEYLYEKGIIKFIPTVNMDNIEKMIKNLQEEAKFIHENKFRQIYNN